MTTRSLLEEGTIWRIGNSEIARIWTDKWITKPISFRPQSAARIRDEDANVAALNNTDTKQ